MTTPSSLRRGALLALLCAGPVAAQLDCALNGTFARAVIRGNQAAIHAYHPSTLASATVILTNGNRLFLSPRGNGAFGFGGSLPPTSLVSLEGATVEGITTGGTLVTTTLQKPGLRTGRALVVGAINGTVVVAHVPSKGLLVGRGEFNPPLPPGTTARVVDAQGNVVATFGVELRAIALNAPVGQQAAQDFANGDLDVVFDDGTDQEIARGDLRVYPGHRVAVGDGAEVVPPTASPGQVLADVVLLEDDRLSVLIVVLGIPATRVDVGLAPVGQNGPLVFRPFAVAPNLYFDVSPVLTPTQRAAYLAGDTYVEVFGTTAGDRIRGQLRERPSDDVLGDGCPGSGGEIGTVLATEGPMPGTGVGLTLIGAAPQAVAFHVIGFDEGPYVSLAPQGYPGCFVMIQPAETRALVFTSATGVAIDFVPIPPLASLVGAVLYSQWAIVEPSPSLPGGNHLSLSRALRTVVLDG